MMKMRPVPTPASPCVPREPSAHLEGGRKIVVRTKERSSFPGERSTERFNLVLEDRRSFTEPPQQEA